MWSRVRVLGKLRVTQLVKKLAVFYEILRFIIVYTTASLWTLFWNK
jgi:hypothetical protein